jgi:hypothetical protein
MSPEQWRPCQECGEETLNQRLCRDCDIAEMLEPCSECGHGPFMTDPHQPPCSLAKPCTCCSKPRPVHLVKPAKDASPWSGFGPRAVYLCVECWQKLGRPPVWGEVPFTGT